MSIPKGKHIHLQDGDVIEKGGFIVEGDPAPQVATKRDALILEERERNATAATSEEPERLPAAE